MPAKARTQTAGRRRQHHLRLVWTHRLLTDARPARFSRQPTRSLRLSVTHLANNLQVLALIRPSAILGLQADVQKLVDQLQPDIERFLRDEETKPHD